MAKTTENGNGNVAVLFGVTPMAEGDARRRGLAPNQKEGNRAIPTGMGPQRTLSLIPKPGKSMADRTIFVYGETEVSYLKKRDKRLAEVMEKVGPIEREVIPDVFAALVNAIIGQQISTKAHKTIWKRLATSLGKITPLAIDRLGVEELQRFGITFKKAFYIKSAAQKVLSGEFDIESLKTLSDEEVCAKLVELDGIGTWTAEMLMIFSMQRRNVLSFGDLALLRGMRMVYRHKVITKQRFDRYKRRFSPYASVAGLYFWAVAGGAMEGMRDYAPADKTCDENRGKDKSGKSQRRNPS